MIFKKDISLLLISCLISSGCASIVGRDVFPVNFQSNPDDAKIVVTDEKGNTVFSGRTPTVVTLAAGSSYFHAKKYTVSFTKDGYDEQTIVVKSSLSGWYFGNIIFGGLIGLLIVDPITGKMWKLPDTPVFGNLAQKTAKNGSASSLQIATLDQVPQNLRSKLIALN